MKDRENKIPYVLVGIILPILLSSGIAFAHGEAVVHVGDLHPETQIGLPNSIVGQDPKELATTGMTREEVALQIWGMQAPEERRMLVKLSLLSIFIVGLVYLYLPRKRLDASVSSLVDSDAEAPPTPKSAGTTDQAPSGVAHSQT